jgi:diacylglycerol kinase family enzyme
MALPVILLNSRAGSAAVDARRIEDALNRVGWQAEVRKLESHAFPAAASEAVREGAPAVVAAGGDGTVSVVAAALVGTPVPMGILPLGTLNHFAKDLGIPLDLTAAVRVLSAGNVRRVDVGEVNGRPFVNNCSIGLYPHIVTYRDRQRERLGRNKWFAMGLAVLSVVGRYPRVHVVIDGPGLTMASRTPLVFVGNNRYDINLLNLGSRPALNRGELSVYLVDAPGRLSLIALAVRLLLGKLRAERDFASFVVPRVGIETRRRLLRVAVDGEVHRLGPPLEFRTRPGALAVLAPPRIE